MRKDLPMLTFPLSLPRISPFFRDTVRFAALAALLGAFLGLVPLGADAFAREANHLRIGAKAYGVTHEVEVGLNKSLIVDLPADVREVIVSQPAVAGAIMRNKRRAVIQGSAAGGTNIFFLDAAGEAIAVLDVSVGGGADALVSTLARVIPGSNIQVEAFGEGIVLSGTVPSGADAEKAVLIASRFTGDASRIANALTVTGSQQVMLHVTIAEVNRSVAKQLGVNFSGSLSANGLTTALINNRGSDGGSVVAAGGPGQFNVSGSLGPVSVSASLRALASRNGVRLLAEPVLTALSGENADFLVGGEFPIQIIDPNTNVPTIEFKEFGVKLNFTPSVRANGIIGLKLETEASEIVSAQGQLSTRRATTSVELPTGRTLVIGGLLQDSLRQQINRLPVLGDIPILGALFRSRDYQRSQTELLILVTPYLAHAGAAPELPTDRYVDASDAEAIFLGRMEAMYGVGSEGMRGGYDGQVGFVLD